MAAGSIPIPSTKPSSIMPKDGGIISPAATEDGLDSAPVDLTIPADLVGPLEDLLSTLDPEDPLTALVQLLQDAKAPLSEEEDPLAGLGEKMTQLRGAV